MLRYQLPVYSPLTLRALRAGAAALIDGGQRAEARVQAALTAAYAARAVILTDSGTSALRLALAAAARAAPGRPVALPAYGCYDIATAALGAGVEAVLYDLDAATLAPNPQSFMQALGARPAAVVVAELFGYPMDLPAIAERVRDAGSLLVEDAAQANGGTFGDHPLGSFGSLAVLSFNRGKGVTGGRGGALLANDGRGRELLETVPAMQPARPGVREFLASISQWLLARPSLYRLPAALPFLRLGETVFREPAPPAAPPASTSGILSVTLGLAASEAACRSRHAKRLLPPLRASGGLRTVEPHPGGQPGYLRLPALAASERLRQRACASGRSLGVAACYPLPLSRLGGFASRCRNGGATFPGAETLAARLLTLPTHGRLRPADLRALERWLEDRGTRD
jgi:dTDP-4-amino-4,6-dideoxygalactose transaminase